jgi:2-isopropylmalate synthase
VPVSLTEEESVRNTWEALKEAVKPRLQVVVPVSSVQMEYLLHMKPEAAIKRVDQKIRECRALTDNVELIAQDATRSDRAFLVRMISAGVEAGAKTVTLCDTAGVMMPEEISGWLDNLKNDLPVLQDVKIGLYCSGELNMADACAVSAIRAGVREIKAATCAGNSISLSNIIRILNVKGRSFGVFTRVGVEQIRRITTQVDMICHTAGRKLPADGDRSEETENDILLSVHDSFETLMHAVEKLGYDLNTEDQQKVWKYFRGTAEKKEHITLRELDAIIAAEAMQVPPAYHDIRYVINTGNQIGAMAHMKLMFHNQEIEGIASGDGAIDAAFNSVEQATGRHFELDDFQIQSVSEGREAMGETVVRLRWEGKLYSGRGISTDIVGAGIMAYINAVNKIVYEEEEA